MFNTRKFFRSFYFAVEGIYYAFKYDQNLLFHIIAACIVIILSLFLHVAGFEIGILGITILMVISAEMVNSAIEKMVDLITKEHRQEAKIAKDVSAGMVLVTASGAAVIGLIIFIPYILKYFHL